MTRIAVVTGGSRGIGAAISLQLKAAGRTVVATYAANDAAAHAFTSATGIKAYKFDVSKFDECKAAVDKIRAEVGPIEILVNNAMASPATPLHLRGRKARSMYGTRWVNRQPSAFLLQHL